jgi:hypothetical protein
MTIGDLGPLDWRTPIVDGQGRPSPEFQRHWNTQRGNNALIGTVTLFDGVPTGTPGEGALAVDISASPFVFYVGHSGAWDVAGVRDFINLADVPSNYTGAADQLLRVKSDLSGLEFAALSAILDGISSTRGSVLYRGASGWAALAPGTAGQVLQTGGPGADPSWVAQSGGGGAGGFTLSQPLASNFNTPSAATVGTIIRPISSGTIIGIGLTFGIVVGGVYKFGFAPFNSSTNVLTAAPVYTPTFTGVTAQNRPLYIPFASPAPFTPGEWMVFMVRSDSTATVSQSISVASGACTSPGIWVDGNTSDTARNLASVSPTTSQTWSVPTQLAWGFTLGYTLQ